MMKPKYRISWLINGFAGRGEWCLNTNNLDARLKELNVEWGRGTHWIESKP